MPADWSAAFGGDFLGRVRYVRTFNSPPGLQPDERVWLVVEPQRSVARVVMAEETLGVVAAERPAAAIRRHPSAWLAQSAGDFRRSSGARGGEKHRRRSQVASARGPGRRSAIGNRRGMMMQHVCRSWASIFAVTASIACAAAAEPKLSPPEPAQ